MGYRYVHLVKGFPVIFDTKQEGEPVCVGTFDECTRFIDDWVTEKFASDEKIPFKLHKIRIDDTIELKIVYADEEFKIKFTDLKTEKECYPNHQMFGDMLYNDYNYAFDEITIGLMAYHHMRCAIICTELRKEDFIE